MKVLNSHSRGFMLLESLLAISIFSIAITSLVLAIKGSSDLVISIEREQWIQQKFRNVLTQTLKQQQTKEEFLTEKTIDFEEFGATAKVEVSEANIETENSEILNNLYEMKITINWYDGTKKRQTTHTTLHHFPLYQY